MSATKLTTMTWLSNEDENLPAITAARTAFIETMTAEGKTDGVGTAISPTVTTRSWIDQAAAEEWQTFITTTATDNGVTVDVVISDI